jgi:hypothetical protein
MVQAERRGHNSAMKRRDHDVLQSADPLLHPARLWSQAEVLAHPSPVPATPGIYAWYFPPLPIATDCGGCVEVDGWRLLYVGISPKPPPANGAPASRQQLRSRLRQHYAGNAAGSTLRLTLGCLLASELGVQLRRVGSGQRLTFADGEGVLSAWMGRHARVCWMAHPRPWELEQALVARLDARSRTALVCPPVRLFSRARFATSHNVMVALLSPAA